MPILIAAIVPSLACSLAFPTHELRSDPTALDASVGPADGGPTTPPTPPPPTRDDGGVDPSAPAGPSCNGLASTCGPAHDRSCCAIALAPKAAFKRGYDGRTKKDARYVALVSDVRLDVYEATVGRFRKFVEAFTAKPAPGAGSNPHNAADHGWSSSFDKVASSREGLESDLEKSCDKGTTTWTKSAGANESLPMTCVSWSEAFAFCIWDGGRLPTEAEWNLAAAGGDEQRSYPWPTSAPDIDAAHAVFATTAPLAVGSRSPAGDGRWGHSDLAGNVAEWTLDWLPEPDTSYPLPCEDCANLAETGRRVVRGGSFLDSADVLLAPARASEDPVHRLATIGVRCAR